MKLTTIFLRKHIMLAQLIQKSLILMNIIFIESYAFSSLPLHQCLSHKKAKSHNTELFGTSSSSIVNKLSDSSQYETKSKTRGDGSKLYYQNPTDVAVWMDEDIKEATDFSMPLANLLPSYSDFLNYQEINNSKNLLKVKSLANEGKLLIDKMRKLASLMNDADLYCEINNIDDKQECKRRYDHHEIKQKYEAALQNAKDCDLKYGLCSVESLNAWDIVDDIYLKYERYCKEDDTNDEHIEHRHPMNDILKACDLLETTFLDLHHKI